MMAVVRKTAEISCPFAFVAAFYTKGVVYT